MKTRSLLGFVCVAAGFALIILLGYGVIPPLGMSAPARSPAAALQGLLPSVLIAAALFGLGLWLLKGKRLP